MKFGLLSAVLGRAQSGGGSGRLIRVSEQLSDSERLILSALIHEALRSPFQGRRPEDLIEDASPRPLGSFSADDLTLSLSGGVAPLPPRWAVTPDRRGVFYLVPGPAGRDLRQFGIKAAPHLLIAVNDSMRMVLSVFDGAPSDATLKGALADSMTDPDFLPLAAFDTVGEAVTLYRDTPSGIGAEIPGGAPYGERPATIELPDGRYFTPGPSGQTVMRAPGLPCPVDLGGLSRRRLLVLDGREDTLNLGCEYGSDDVFVLIFANRLPMASLVGEFEHRRAGMLMDCERSSDLDQLLELESAPGFHFGATWLAEDQRARGIWLGRAGEFVIEVNAGWNPDSHEEARDAVKRLHDLFFAGAGGAVRH